MSIFSDAEDKVKEYVLSVGLQKAALALGQALASFLIAHAIPGLLAPYGVTVSVDPAVLAAAVMSVFKFVCDFLGTRFPALSWLAPAHPDAPPTPPAI